MTAKPLAGVMNGITAVADQDATTVTSRSMGTLGKSADQMFFSDHLYGRKWWLVLGPLSGTKRAKGALSGVKPFGCDHQG